jgi:hypothetical protein
MDPALGVVSAQAAFWPGAAKQGVLCWTSDRLPKNAPFTKMQVPEEKSAKRSNRVPRRGGGSGDIEIAVLIPLVLVANTIVATIAWYIVGSLLR